MGVDWQQVIVVSCGVATSVAGVVQDADRERPRLVERFLEGQQSLVHLLFRAVAEQARAAIAVDAAEALRLDAWLTNLALRQRAK